MAKKIIAPHKVRLDIRSRFNEPLCFEWGSEIGYLDEIGLRKFRKFSLLKNKKKVKLADDYVLVYQNRFGRLIEPPQIRLGRQKGEMTLRARIFRIDELQLLKK